MKSELETSIIPIQQTDLVQAEELGFVQRFQDTLKTLFVEELPEPGQRIKRLGALSLGAATQFVDRGRAMVFALPFAFDESMEYAMENGYNAYQTAGLTGLSVSAVFGVWGYAVGKSFHVSLNAFPETTDRVQKNHPAMVGVISTAIGGFPSEEELVKIQPDKPEEGYDVGPYVARSSLLGKMGVALSRGLKTAFLYGTTAQVGMAKVNEYSDESNGRLRRASTLEAAGILGGVAMGMSALITNDFMGAAEDIRDVITNKTYLTALSALFIGSAIVTNHFSRKKFIKESTDEGNEEQKVDGQSMFSRPDWAVE